MVNEVGSIDASFSIRRMCPKEDPERTGEVTNIEHIPAMHLTYLFRLITDRLRVFCTNSPGYFRLIFPDEVKKSVRIKVILKLLMPPLLPSIHLWSN